MVGITLEGEAAVDERRRLLEDGREINVGVRERDARGGRRALWLQFGMCSSTAWVFCMEESKEPKIILECVLVHEAAELFGGYLERMMIRKGLVDPSPLSPAFVEIQPCIEHVIEDLGAEFGIKVSLK